MNGQGLHSGIGVTNGHGLHSGIGVTETGLGMASKERATTERSVRERIIGFP
jgi:hypothetical protein